MWNEKAQQQPASSFFAYYFSVLFKHRSILFTYFDLYNIKSTNKALTGFELESQEWKATMLTTMPMIMPSKLVWLGSFLLSLLS